MQSVAELPPRAARELEMNLKQGRVSRVAGAALCALATSACDAATPIGAALTAEEAEANGEAALVVADGGALDPLLTPVSPGLLPSQVPDCVNNERIFDKDAPQSIYLDNQRFGWAEWRIGNYGNCRGVQWVRFHLQASIPGPFELRYLVDDGTPTGVGYAWPDGLAGSSDEEDVGLTHDGPLLFNANVICALVARPDVPRSEWPVFGAFISQIPLQHLIPGTLC